MGSGICDLELAYIEAGERYLKLSTQFWGLREDEKSARYIAIRQATSEAKEAMARAEHALKAYRKSA